MDPRREEPGRYHLRLMFEWGGGCLWAGNGAARAAFDVGHVEDLLPLSRGDAAPAGGAVHLA